MSKLSSKLAAGVRQVKTDRGAAPAAQATEGKAQPAAERRQVGGTEPRSELHPARVWPD